LLNRITIKIRTEENREGENNKIVVKYNNKFAV